MRLLTTVSIEKNGVKVNIMMSIKHGKKLSSFKKI